MLNSRRQSQTEVSLEWPNEICIGSTSFEVRRLMLETLCSLDEHRSDIYVNGQMVQSAEISDEVRQELRRCLCHRYRIARMFRSIYWCRIYDVT
jgi:translation elongation factor EF-G